MLCVGCSGLDADPRSLDVYITYVRMHNGKVNTLLCLWETSAVNKKWSSTIAGRDFFVLVCFFGGFFFSPISQTKPMIYTLSGSFYSFLDRKHTKILEIKQTEDTEMESSTAHTHTHAHPPCICITHHARLKTVAASGLQRGQLYLGSRQPDSRSRRGERRQGEAWKPETSQ